MTRAQMISAVSMVFHKDGFDAAVMLAQDYTERYGIAQSGGVAGLLVESNAGYSQWYCSVIYVDTEGHRISKFSSDLAGMHGHNECYRWIYDAKEKRGLELEYYMSCVCVTCADPDCDDDHLSEADQQEIDSDAFDAKFEEMVANGEIDVWTVPGVIDLARESYNNEILKAIEQDRDAAREDADCDCGNGESCGDCR